MRRRERIRKGVAVGLQPEMPDLADVAVAEQLLEKLPALHAVRRRAEHGDEVRLRLRGGEHLAGLAQIHGHARLAENVFAGLERGDSYGRVEDGRRTDPDDVDVAPIEHLGPVAEDFGDLEFLRDGLGRFRTRVAHGDDLDVRQRLQSGRCFCFTMPPAPMMPTRSFFDEFLVLMRWPRGGACARILRRPAAQCALACYNLTRASDDFCEILVVDISANGKAHRGGGPVGRHAHGRENV